MKYVVLLFGPYADAAGADRVELLFDSDHSRTAAEINSALAEQAPAMAPMLSAARLAVNNRLADRDQVVTATDELALIGLVGGG